MEGSSARFALLRDPKLIDIVDEEWAKDTLSDDGMALWLRGMAKCGGEQC